MISDLDDTVGIRMRSAGIMRAHEKLEMPSLAVGYQLGSGVAIHMISWVVESPFT